MPNSSDTLPKPPANNATMTIRMPEDLRRRLRVLAINQRRTDNAVALMALEQFAERNHSDSLETPTINPVGGQD